MDCKIFDIPFRVISDESDFNCKDGEILFEDKDLGVGDALPGLGDKGLGIGEKMAKVEFGLVRSVLPGWHINPDVYPVKTVVGKDSSMEYWNKIAAQLLQQLKWEAEDQNMFVSPFYVMAGWKTAAGQFLPASDPVLMVPNSVIPVVTTDGGITSDELDMKVAAAVCRLWLKIKTSEILRDYVGTVESLEILVSDPILKYDSYTLLPTKHATTDNYCESLDPVSGTISRERVCTQTLNLAWKAPSNSLSVGELKENFSNSKNFFTYASLPLGEVDLYDGWTDILSSRFTVNGVSGKNRQHVSFTQRADGELILESENQKHQTVVGTGREIDVITRPLKLSGAGRMKVTRFVSLRG